MKHLGKTPPFRDSHGEPLAGSIATVEVGASPGQLRGQFPPNHEIAVPALSALALPSHLRPFRRHKGSGPIRTYSDSLGRTVVIMNSLNLSFSSVFGRCAERSNQTSCLRGAFNASKYFAESTEGTS